jgi:hypothetical protein
MPVNRRPFGFRADRFVLIVGKRGQTCQAKVLELVGNNPIYLKQREPGRKSSSTSRSNQIKHKLITFTGRFNACSIGRKPIARVKGDPRAIGKSKEDLQD